MVLTADLTTHFNGTMGSLLTVEEITVIQFHFINTVEPPHKIQMPVATAKLAIGNGVITSTLLLLDQAGDLLIFHSGQRGTVDLAGLNWARASFKRWGRRKLPTKS